jgi:maltose alpha-D-glucosyltransferase/alpha-amylase
MKQKTPEMPDDLRPAVKAMLDRQDHVLALFKSVLDTKFTATRVRCHGDLHLGQVLFTGNDFVIMDFEGEPARSLGDRRIKRSPLRDAAGMLRSFHYAAHVALFAQKDSGILSAEESDYANALTDFWCYWVSAAYLRAYLRTAGSASFIPASTHELRVMLDAYVLEKAIYELGYELNNRPDWVKIPIEGMAQILGELP